MEVTDIEHGSNVYGADDEKGGDLSEVQDTYIVVSKGLIFPNERYIPTSAITRVEHDRVYRNLTKDEVKARGWEPGPGDWDAQRHGWGAARAHDGVRPEA